MKKVMELKTHDEINNTPILELQKTGRATADLLSKLWKEDHHDFQLICLIMRAHGLMQAIKSSDKSVPDPTHATCTEPQGEFMIPCMLNHEEKFHLEGYTFYFDFKGFLPQEVFHCLICLVIKKCQEVPGHHYSPKYWTNACIWYCMKGYDWNVQLLSGEHKLKFIAR